MTIRLRLISDENEKFIRDIEISANDSFLDLHNFIQKDLNYNNGEMASFFETDNDWNKEIEIPLIDMKAEGTTDVVIMADAILGDYISEAKQRLLYTFDMFSDRNLFIEVYEVDKKKCKTPSVLKSGGEAPKPVSMDAILEDDGKKPEFDMDSFDDEFNDDSDNDDIITYSDNLEDL